MNVHGKKNCFLRPNPKIVKNYFWEGMSESWNMKALYMEETHKNTPPDRPLFYVNIVILARLNFFRENTSA